MPNRARIIATIDTSALISLRAAKLLGAISVLFDRILVPAKVREELLNGRRQHRSTLREMKRFAIFEHCDEYDLASVRLLLDTRANFKKGRDEGEAEAVIQAAAQSADMTLIDDGLGRRWARQHALECHGSIWICRELRRTGYIAQLRRPYVRMLMSGRHQPLQKMNAYLVEFGESPLPEWFARILRMTRLYLWWRD